MFALPAPPARGQVSQEKRLDSHPPSEPSRPTAPERVRTVLTRAVEARIAVDGAHPSACRVVQLRPDGSLALTAPAASGVGDLPLGATGVLEVIDLAAVPTGESVRTLVWARGRVRPTHADDVLPLLDQIALSNPDPALLDVGHGDVLVLLEVDSIVVADASGADDVPLAAVHQANPDPFSLSEAAWVRHLHEHHPDIIERLRLRLPRRIRRGSISLLGLDRYGLQVRTEGPEGRWDFRIPFLTPADDDASLGRALLSLMGCPFTHGLRARP